MCSRREFLSPRCCRSAGFIFVVTGVAVIEVAVMIGEPTYLPAINPLFPDAVRFLLFGPSLISQPLM